MLSIRMQRLGRKGHSMYRIIVQDSRRTPTSGKYVALLGSYDPHTKISRITKDKAELYLKNGAQPSDRLVRLFKAEKISLPKWVSDPTKKSRKIKNPDKLRRNRPAEEKVVEPVAEASTEVPANEEVATTDEVKVGTPVASETATPEQEAPTSEVAEAPAEKATEVQSEEIEKDDGETKTPPNEDEFPEDKKTEPEETKKS